MIRYRFFLDIIDAQEIWLNNLADNGYRLKEVKLCKYIFEECNPSEYVYMIDAVTSPAISSIEEREVILGEHKLRIMRNKQPLMGNTTFLICEKKLNDEPLEISTSAYDGIICYKKIRSLVLSIDIILLMFTILTLITDLFSGLPIFKFALAFLVFWLTSTGFKSTQIISDYIARYKLNEPL